MNNSEYNPDLYQEMLQEEDINYDEEIKQEMFENYINDDNQ